MSTSHVQLSGEDLLRLHDQNILTTCLLAPLPSFYTFCYFLFFNIFYLMQVRLNFLKGGPDLCLGAFSRITQILRIS